MNSAFIATARHAVDEGFEEYVFRSGIGGYHFIDRTGDAPWRLSLAVTDSLSVAEATLLARELGDLLEFVDTLASQNLHRRTPPGAPAFEEGI